MKRKTSISIVLIIIIALLGGGIWYYNEQTTIPHPFTNRILTSSQVDNNLSNWFDLFFTKNHAILVAKNGGNKEVKNSQLNREILAAFSVKKGEAPDAGDKVDLGRIKVIKEKHSYRIQTRKVTFIFTKISSGAYRSQDNTVWQFSPK